MTNISYFIDNKEEYMGSNIFKRIISEINIKHNVASYNDSCYCEGGYNDSHHSDCHSDCYSDKNK